MLFCREHESLKWKKKKKAFSHLQRPFSADLITATSVLFLREFAGLALPIHDFSFISEMPDARYGPDALSLSLNDIHRCGSSFWGDIASSSVHENERERSIHFLYHVSFTVHHIIAEKEALSRWHEQILMGSDRY